VLGLVWFSIRRLLLLGAALSPARDTRDAPTDDAPSVTLAVPAHNEEALVDGLGSALDRLDYPAEKLDIVLLSDGSTDATLDRMRAWADRRPHARVVELPRRAGKSGALNEAFAIAQGDLLVVLDADLLPRQDFLRQLVPVFSDESVGAATALLNPANATETLISRYAAVDAWVNQLIVGAGKDRLRLNPPTFGASAFRRAALEEIGGFWLMHSGEDVEAALALERAGWRTRFRPGAVADNRVTSTVSDYWRQHIRWARGTYAARNARRLPHTGRLIDRVEAWNVAVGYFDRVCFLAALLLAAKGRFPWRVIVAYLAVPGAEVVAAVAKTQRRRDLAGFGLATIAVFPLDLAATVAAMIVHFAGRPHVWRSPRARPTGVRGGNNAVT
jgi:cellulose synthase/poly-beta-1,6-N-acetylglucosamine synthase-like glycosyltransferase